ncbi:MAG TPA: alpha/beta fold hydrolase [Bryobacteraceae bacterium]|nr:alpha/beta fold hydrolase [Bryobacteraceae bacterium]
MSTRLIAASLATALVTALTSDPATALQIKRTAAPRESRIPVGKATLYSREIGQGQPIIVLHGGPDFDHGYLLPDLDRLADAFRLIYYDQRGRGRSADRVLPEDVTLTSDLEDLDKVRQHFHLRSTALLGHSWGTVLALEYALRHPERVSCMILMNPAPASAGDLAVFRKAYVQKLGADMDRQREIMAGAAYKQGDPEAVAARYRLHFKPALTRPDDYEKLMATMKAAFISQGKEGIVKARAVEDRLMRDTWLRDGYDLLPKLQSLSIPTLVLSGDHDFLPPEIAEHIARAIPKAQLVMLKSCGHFPYLESPGAVHSAIDEFFQAHAGSAGR